MSNTDKDTHDLNLPAAAPRAAFSLEAQPLRAYLLDMARDVTAGQATLNWQANNAHVKGEVAAVKRCMARALAHAYGLDYADAFTVVDYAVQEAVGERSIIDPKWGAYKASIAEAVVRELLA